MIITRNIKYFTGKGATDKHQLVRTQRTETHGQTSLSVAHKVKCKIFDAPIAGKFAAVFSVLIMAGTLTACADYTVKTSADPSSAFPGGKGKVTVRLKAGGKYHLDPKGMYLIMFEPPAGITLDKTELRTEDLGKGNTFSTGFAIAPDSRKGTLNISAKITFQLCTDTLCRIITEERHIPVTVH